MSNAKEYKRYKEKQISETANLFESIYAQAKGYIKIMSGNNRKGRFYNPSAISDENKLSAILEADRFRKSNVFISTATYRTMQNATKGNILNICALAVDVNYTLHPGQKDISYEQAAKALEVASLDGFPRPTYIEHSRNLRLVYVLDKPYIIPKTKKRTDCIKFLERIVQHLAEELNKHTEIIHFNATPQRLTSFIRIPHSIDKRTYGSYDHKENRYIVTDTELYYVDIDTNDLFWDVDKLAERVLPPLFDGYEVWKAKQKGKSTKKNTHQKRMTVPESRIKELEELQRRGYDVEYREKLCYLYWVTVKQNGMVDDDALNAVRKFNQNFKIPLDEHHLSVDCRPHPYIDGKTGKHCEGWERRFTDRHIRKFLDLGSAEPDLFGGKGMTNAEKKRVYNAKKRKERELAGDTKQQQIERQLVEVERLRSEGKKWKEVAEILGVSEMTAKNYGKRLKEKKVS